MDYLYLQGEIYLRDRAIEDKWIFIGNTSGATIRWESEIVSVPELATGMNAKNHAMEVRNDITLSIEMDSFEELQIPWQGEKENQPATTVTEEPHTAYPNERFYLNYAPVKNVVIAGKTEGEDYRVDEKFGSIFVFSGQGITREEEFLVDYEFHPNSQVGLLTQRNKRHEVRFCATNMALNRFALIEFFKVKFRPFEQWELISREYSSMVLGGSVLYDKTRPANDPRGKLFSWTQAITAQFDIDPETYIVCFVDSSGSMNDSIPDIRVAINDLRDILRDQVWGGSEELTDYYFSKIELSNERWVDWMAEDYRNDSSDADKLITLIWIDEADPKYHTDTDIQVDNFPDLQADLASLDTAFQNRERFNAILFAVIGNHFATDAFQQHVAAARDGTNGFPKPFSEYNTEFLLNVASDTTGGTYFNIIADLLS